MTIAFGHGLAVAPLQSMMAVSALVNGGKLVKPTFRLQTIEEAQANAPQVIRPKRASRCATSCASTPKSVLHGASTCPAISRRQDRHREQGRQRSLFERQGIHHVHRHRAVGQAEVSLPHRIRRAPGRACNVRSAHGGVERGRNDRAHHRTRFADPQSCAASRDSAGQFSDCRAPWRGLPSSGSNWR